MSDPVRIPRVVRVDGIQEGDQIDVGDRLIDVHVVLKDHLETVFDPEGHSAPQEVKMFTGDDELDIAELSPSDLVVVWR